MNYKRLHEVIRALWGSLLGTLCFSMILFAGSAFAEENPFEDHPVSVESGLFDEKPIPTPEIAEPKPADPAPVPDLNAPVIEVPVGGVATFSLGAADIIEQAGQLVCMTGNPIGCIVSVVAGLVKHKDGTALEKASTIKNLSPLPGPIGVIGKAVAIANYSKVAYDNREKISEVLEGAGNSIATQPPAPVEEREIIPLPADK